MHRGAHRRLDGVLLAVRVLPVHLVVTLQDPERLLRHMGVEEGGPATRLADDLGQEVGVVGFVGGDLEGDHVTQDEVGLALVGTE